jgi:hypothetical protein
MISFIHVSIGLKSWYYIFCSSQNPKLETIGVLSIAPYQYILDFVLLVLPFLINVNGLHVMKCACHLILWKLLKSTII